MSRSGASYRRGLRERGAARSGCQARWSKEEGSCGAWTAVVTEIPYTVQKSKLIEKIAELLADKKLPTVADVRDRSAEDIRVVIEPHARAVDPAMMMEQLFRLTELESRFPLNMNLLADGVVRVVSFKEALRQWLDHRRGVLLRRARHRQAGIVHRLELVAGLFVVFLNLDAVIGIIREADDPKQELQTIFRPFRCAGDLRSRHKATQLAPA